MKKFNNRPAYSAREIYKLLEELKVKVKYEFKSTSWGVEVLFYDKSHENLNIAVCLDGKTILGELRQEFNKAYGKLDQCVVFELNDCYFVSNIINTSDLLALDLFFTQVYEAMKVLAVFKQLISEHSYLIRLFDNRIDKKDVSEQEA